MPQARRKPTSDPNPAETPEQPASPSEEQPPVGEPASVTTDAPAGRGRLLRLAVAGVIVAVIVVASFIAWPIVYGRWIAPIGDNTADVGELRSQLTDLQAQVDALNSAQADAAARVDALDEATAEQLAEHDRLLTALDAMDRSLASDDQEAQAEVSREVSLLKAMELMSRARLFLYESNFGLAEQDLAAARELLAGLDQGTTSTDVAAISAAVERLDRTLDALPDFPVVASDDLDIAWQALLGNVPPPAEASPEASATPGASATPAATASP